MIAFFQPVWLLLAIPLAVAWLLWRLPNRGLQIVRAVVFILIILALAQLALRLPDRSGTVIVVADRSESMPKQSAAAERELVDLLHKSMKPRDLLGVVSFGRQAIVEQTPQAGSFSGFTAQVGTDHSDLNNAIETALALIPPDAGGRIVVLSDGKWTGKDPAAASARAAGRGVPIDYRLLARPQVNDVAIQSFLTPDSVLPGQAYVLSGWIRSPANQEVQYQLRRGSTILSSGTKEVSAGLTRLMFRDRALEAGVYDYTLTVTGPKDDPIPENNEARALVSIEGSRPMLIVSSAAESSGLARLLKNGGVDVIARTPDQCRWSLEELSQYSAVLVENVSANRIGTSSMETLASWVEGAASGLMMTGGQKSYGPGGYFKSPLDRIMPVSMEMRREHRKMSLAIVVTMDRSGSMAMPAGGGRTKMDLADLGAVQVLDLLSPMDELGVIAVDSSPHTIVPLAAVDINKSERGRILSIDSMGGGIFIYEALAAAASMIVGAHAETRHIILFADAADSEEPGNYQELVAKCRESGVTISVVGMGTEADSDANLLKDIAARGGGTCYFASSPDEIPRMFAQDTFTVARSTFIDSPSPFQFTAGFSSLGSDLGEAPPTLGGYNLCYLRPEANLAAVTADEYKAPVVATWNAGNGRVSCFLGEADGKYSGDFAKWKQSGEFYATLARWTAGKRQALPDDEMLTQQVRDGVCLVQLHLSPDRTGDPFSITPKVRVLHGLTGTPPDKEVVALQWKSADLLEAAIPIAGREVVLNTVEISGQQPVTLAPACLPYSPEFAPDQLGRGGATLVQLAATTGGKERIDISQVWTDLESKPRYVDLSPWLLVGAVTLFILEIFERRTGWVSRIFRGRSVTTAAVEEAETTETTQEQPKAKRFLWKQAIRPKRPAVPTSQKKEATVAPAKSEASSVPAQAPSPSRESDSNLEALRKARERAERRTNRKN